MPCGTCDSRDVGGWEGPLLGSAQSLGDAAAASRADVHGAGYMLFTLSWLT